MNPLTTLGIHHGTDKATHHRYTDFYFELLEPRKHTIKTVLEIGVLQGASLRMWRDYFGPDVIVIGLDNNPPKVEGCYTFDLNCDNINDVLYLAGMLGPFQLVVDDGSHTMRQQQTLFGALFPHVTWGGLYIIEDIHTSLEDFKNKKCPYTGQLYHHPNDSIDTATWIDKKFTGSNYVQNGPNLAAMVKEVRHWHNFKNPHNDSYTIAIEKLGPIAFN